MLFHTSCPVDVINVAILLDWELYENPLKDHSELTVNLFKYLRYAEYTIIDNPSLLQVIASGFN
jgi:hypothetical protein